MKFYRPPMTEPEKDKLRTNAANADLRLARKHGNILIVQTNRGTLGLTYHPVTRLYTLRQLGTMHQEPATIAERVTAATARAELKKTYVIEE